MPTTAIGVIEIDQEIEEDIPEIIEKRLTPTKAIRTYCVEHCCNGSHHEVRMCPSESCALFSRRFGKRPAGPDPLTPLKATRARCVDCASGFAGVRECEDYDCPLWEYRMGKNPARKGVGGGGHIRVVDSETPHSAMG